MTHYTLTSDEVQATPFVMDKQALRNYFQATIIGNFGGGTFNLQKQFEDDIWRDLPEASNITADKMIAIDFKDRSKIRYELTGSTAPDLFVDFQ